MNHKRHNVKRKLRKFAKLAVASWSRQVRKHVKIRLTTTRYEKL